MHLPGGSAGVPAAPRLSETDAAEERLTDGEG